jgi:hypothetical protein
LVPKQNGFPSATSSWNDARKCFIHWISKYWMELLNK